MFNEDCRTGLDSRSRDHPVKPRQIFPDSVTVQFIGVESEDRSALAALDRELRSNFIRQRDIGRGHFNSVKFDRKQCFQWGPPISSGVVLCPGNHDEAATGVTDEITDCLQ